MKTEACDVLVVGSGVVGALVAWKCAARGLDVLMLERGPELGRAELVGRMHVRGPDEVYPPAPRIDFVPAEDGPGHFEALALVGGTTWHWGGMCPRFVPADFQLCSTYGVGMDWPLTYQDLVPLYEEAEREMGITGAPGSGLPLQPPTWLDLQVMEGARKVGMEMELHPSARMSVPGHGRSPCLGFGSCTPVCPSGAMYSGIMHVDQARAAGARLLQNCAAVRLVPGRAGRVEAVECRKTTGGSLRVRPRQVVLAANAVENARLLLASGLCRRGQRPGDHVMTHPSVVARLLARKPVYAGRGPRQSAWWPGGRDGRHRAQMAAHHLVLSNRVEAETAVVAAVEGGALGGRLARAVVQRLQREVLFYLNVEQLPSRENRIELETARRDAFGLPRARIRCAIDAYARRGMDQLKERVRELARVMGDGVVQFQVSPSTSHVMGTTPMGRGPEEGVVDTEGRCFEHPNVFLAGSSVFVTGSTANPTLTAAALALRTAQAVAGQV